jgi:hypothetical protein
MCVVSVGDNADAEGGPRLFHLPTRVVSREWEQRDRGGGFGGAGRKLMSRVDLCRHPLLPRPRCQIQYLVLLLTRWFST